MFWHQLSRDEWFEHLVAAAEGRLSAHEAAVLPEMPEPALQQRTTGLVGRASLQEAFAFYTACCAGFERVTGRALDPADRVLDFGTGWARVLRFFLREVGAAHCYGTDVDAELVAQAQTLFPGARFARNAPFPPTDYPDDTFSLIVGYSVFSHLSEAACRAWIKEFYRIARPDGVVALTTRGRWFFDYCEHLRPSAAEPYQAGLARLFPDFAAARAAYDRGDFVHATAPPVSGNAYHGENFYGETFIPEGYARTAWLPWLRLRAWYQAPAQHPIMVLTPDKTVPPAQTNRWPAAVIHRCQRAAARFGVTAAVHPEDFIFRFLYENPSFATLAAAIDYYFMDGDRSATQVLRVIDQWFERGRRLRVLEFAAGYGAVTRHLSRRLNHELHACDIHPHANAFVAEHCGVTTIPSSSVPEELSLPTSYDMIFALSFFSHMPATTWERWLRRLYAGLNAGGVFLFTTHGRVSREKFFPQAQLDAEGYWFAPYSEQRDLDPAEYGQTVVSQEFVRSRIARLTGAALLDASEAGWWGHQDVYLVRRGALAAAD